LWPGAPWANLDVEAVIEYHTIFAFDYEAPGFLGHVQLLAALQKGVRPCGVVTHAQVHVRR
jgi:hypothetical protein